MGARSRPAGALGVAGRWWRNGDQWSLALSAESPQEVDWSVAAH